VRRGATGRGGGRRPSARAAWAPAALAVLVAVATLAAGLARAERTQQGTLIVSLDGGIAPRKLPRHEPAPAAIHLSGDLRTADGSPLPRLRQVELAVGGRGVLGTRGLPTCSRTQIVAATPRGALAACGDALVGSGRLDVEVFIEGQEPFEFRASLRAFNGRLRSGAHVIWLHVFGRRPPSSFVLPFVVRHRPGAFGTALVATLPPGLGPWPHLARFEMTFGRRFSYRGAPRSFLSADCPLPKRFTAGLFPFARATYSFATGTSVSATIVRGCRVREAP
jgi:hypothetical protein